MTRQLGAIYQKLYSHFGPQHWWPANSPFEVIVGAILTQNTNWLNVEKALRNLKEYRILSPLKLHRISQKRLASLIKPSGYYNIKAERLKEFLRFLFKHYHGATKNLGAEDLSKLREKLLSVKGVGPETADSIALYAFNKPIFVVDAYTKRILTRHGLVREGATYDEVQHLCMRSLKHDAAFFNEYHALLVRVGKEYCLRNKRRCRLCPLQ